MVEQFQPKGTPNAPVKRFSIEYIESKESFSNLHDMVNAGADAFGSDEKTISKKHVCFIQPTAAKTIYKILNMKLHPSSLNHVPN